MWYNVAITGYSMHEWTHTNFSILIEAPSLEEARKKATKWCEDHSTMDTGVDHYVERIYPATDDQIKDWLSQLNK